MIAIALALLLGAPDLDALLVQGRYQEAVAAAPSGAALMKAVLKRPSDPVVKGVVSRVVRLEGPLRDRDAAIRWLLDLAKRRKGDPEALTGAGYLLLVADDAKRALEILEPVAKKHPTGLRLCYLADAYRRAGRDDDARKTLVKAIDLPGADRKFVQDNALVLAARLRAKGDHGYAALLDSLGLGLRAAMWLAEDADYKPTRAAQLQTLARKLFKTSLDDTAPATAWWTAARLEKGDARFAYLVEAVRRGEDPMGEANHACPGAILALAEECAKRGRHVAAAALAKKRLRVGECVAAWELLETLPPALVRSVD